MTRRNYFIILVMVVPLVVVILLATIGPGVRIWSLPLLVVLGLLFFWRSTLNSS
jgi:hypothetical protein